MTDQEIEEFLHMVREYLAETALEPDVEAAFLLVETTLMHDLSYMKR